MLIIQWANRTECSIPQRMIGQAREYMTTGHTQPQGVGGKHLVGRSPQNHPSYQTHVKDKPKYLQYILQIPKENSICSIPKHFF